METSQTAWLSQTVEISCLRQLADKNYIVSNNQEQISCSLCVESSRQLNYACASSNLLDFTTQQMLTYGKNLVEIVDRGRKLMNKYFKASYIILS